MCPLTMFLFCSNYPSTPLRRGSRRDHRVWLAEGRRSRGMQPVLHDSGGRFDVGFSRLRLGLTAESCPPATTSRARLGR